MDFKQHVFICESCQFKTKDGKCSEKEKAEQFRKSVKAIAQEIWPKQMVRINGSKCLGQCERGISCVIYPQGEWLLELRPGDEQKVIKKLKVE